MKNEEISEEEIMELLRQLADEKVPESSPEFYEHEMERVIARKKELESGDNSTPEANREPSSGPKK